MNEHRIKTEECLAYSRGWPVTKYIAAINGVWLVRKDGGLRKFNTRYAAKLAALAEINKESS